MTGPARLAVAIGAAALLMSTAIDAVDARRSKSRARRSPAISSRMVRAIGSVGAFRSCAEARAAGAAPVRAGDRGYSRRLDRDGDGVGCE